MIDERNVRPCMNLSSEISKKFYGKTLRIPKWDEIKDSYLVTKV